MVNIEKLKKEIPEYFTCPYSTLKEVEIKDDFLMAWSGKIIRFCCKKIIPGKPLWRADEKKLFSVLADSVGPEKLIIEKLKKCKDCKLK